LLFIVIGYAAKIRYKNIITLLPGKVCRANTAFAGA